MFCGVLYTYTLNLEGLVPSGPPTIDMLLILTSDVNLQHGQNLSYTTQKYLKLLILPSEQSKSKPSILVET